MKKLIAIGATLAVAYGASAAGAFSTTTLSGHNTESFETAATGAYSPSYERWHSADVDATLEVKEYGQDAKYAYTEGQNWDVATAPGAKYLAIEASKPLYRTPAVTEHGYDETTNMFDYAAEIVANGVFVDTLVKFTATESLDVPDLDGGKIAVWLGTDENAPSTTNLYVTAAAVDANGVLTTTNFQVAKESGTIDPGSWHRLTIRAIPGVGSDENDAPLAGFTVFVDGVQVGYTGNDYASFVSSAKVNGGAAATELSAGKLFISCVPGDTLEAVGFKGTGSIDDVTFADYASAPTFAKGAQVFTFTWTAAEIDAITIGSYQLSAAELAEGSYETNLISGTIGITVDFAEGYTGTESENVTLSAGGTYAITATAAKFAIGNANYATFAEAYADATAGDTITLKANVSETMSMIAITKAITIDVAGKAFVIAATGAAVFNTSAAVTVIDSVGSGSITATGGDRFSYIFQDGATLTIGAATGDNGVTINGCLAEGTNTTIIKGKFDDASNSVNGAFIYAENVYSGSASHENGYWVVNMGGSQQATGWDVVPVQDATAGATWGDDIDSAFAMADAAKLKTWGQTYNIDFDDLDDDTLLDAFLLNCAPDNVTTEKAAFKLSITFENGAPVVSTPAGKNYNVEPVILGKASLSGEWNAAAYDGTHKFFQAVLALPAAVLLQ